MCPVVNDDDAPDAPEAPLTPDLVTDGSGVPVDMEGGSDGDTATVGDAILSDVKDKLDNGVPLAPAEKQRMAVTLRISGATYKQIAGTIGCSVSYAHQLVSTALRDTHVDNVEELRRMQFARQEHMLMLIWPEVNKRNLAAVHTAMALIQAENVLMGVGQISDAPNQGDGGPTIVATGDKDEYIKQLREARERSLTPPPTDGE